MTGDTRTAGVCYLLACFLLTAAVQIGNGHLTLAMLLVAIALAASGIGVGGMRIATVEKLADRALPIGISLLLVSQVALLFRRTPVAAADVQMPLSFVALLIPAAIAAASLVPAMFCIGNCWRRAQQIAFPILLGLHLALGWWVVNAIPFTVMDVYLFHTDAAEALLRSENPYAITFPDLSAGTSAHYGPELQADGRLLFGFPYPPLSLLMAVPGQLLGNDVRYAHAVATTLAGALVFYGARNRLAAALAATMLLSPLTFEMIKQSWTEPFALLLLAVVLWCATRARWATPMALGLLLVIKQYMLPAAALSPLLIPRPWTIKRMWRWAWQAALAAAVVTLPLALADWGAFFHSTVEFHLRQPYRADSLSFPALFTRLTGIVPPTAIVTFVIFGLAQTLAVWRGAKTASGFSAAAGFCLLVFVSVGQQAFANYYYLIIGAFTSAIAFAQVERPIPGACQAANLTR